MHEKITKHSQYDQVEKDVDRSMWKYTKLLTEAERQYKRRQLSRLMNSILSTQSLHYFQGFHDICTVFLLVCGEHISAMCCSQMVQFYLRDFMNTASLEPVLQILKLIFVIIRQEDAILAKHLQDSSNDEGHYALPWVLTWFSHVVEELPYIARLFDLFLASHPLLPMYLATAIVLHRKKEVLAQECDFSYVFKTLNTFPDVEQVPFELLIQDAQQLMHKYPPHELIQQSKLVIANRYAKRMSFDSTVVPSKIIPLLACPML